MAASDKWPPALKKFVNDTFSACTPSNRPAVEAELKAAIFKAFTEETIWNIDWANFKLESLAKQGNNSKNKRKKPDPAFAPSSLGKEYDDLRSKRAKRFELDTSNKTSRNSVHIGSSLGSTMSTPEPEYNPDVIDWDRYTIVGTSATLEKPYLRLTSVPDPANVRPIATLRKTLELMKKKWRAESNYNYVCDQFKSMRQDLTVQRIKNDFTVSVYEIHARIALEKGDLGEYNQCQSQLKDLYTHGLEGHPEEFLAYRILYLLHTRNRREINALLSNLSAAERQDESVQHALQVRLALATANYRRFFQLFNAAPKMGGYMMDHFIPRERVTALVTMTKAYMTLPLTFIASQLAFEDAQEVHSFLEAHNAATYAAADPKAPATSGDKQLDCRAARAGLSAALANYTKVDIKSDLIFSHLRLLGLR